MYSRWVLTRYVVAVRLTSPYSEHHGHEHRPPTSTPTTVLASSATITAIGHGRRDHAAEVVRQQPAPRGMALEDDLLAGVEVHVRMLPPAGAA